MLLAGVGKIGVRAKREFMDRGLYHSMKYYLFLLRASHSNFICKYCLHDALRTSSTFQLSPLTECRGRPCPLHSIGAGFNLIDFRAANNYLPEIHFTQTGLLTAILLPISPSNPVALSILNITTSLLSWLATSSQLPVGSKLKLRGVLPRVA